MANPEICVLQTDGTNCDKEMAYAFDSNGARAEIVHVNQLRHGSRQLNDFAGLGIPGGFSYGDDIVSGKVLANELTSYLGEQVREFTNSDNPRPVLGVCNGFQVLVRAGVLPFGTLGEQQMTLTHNQRGRFECRWVNLRLEIGRTICRFVPEESFINSVVPMQVAHGEGRFIGRQQDIADLEQNGQVVFRYAGVAGQETARGLFPYNPNGSMNDIAGICDPTGTILGMMPHPERSIQAFHPHRIQTEDARYAAKVLFGNIVDYAKEL